MFERCQLMEHLKTRKLAVTVVSILLKRDMKHQDYSQKFVSKLKQKLENEKRGKEVRKLKFHKENEVKFKP